MGFTCFSETAVVTKILSPETMGDDQARPGSATFHCTFLSGPQASGSLESSATPAPLGPRNCGQSPPGARLVRNRKDPASTRKKAVRMSVFLFEPIVPVWEREPSRRGIDLPVA